MAACVRNRGFSLATVAKDETRFLGASASCLQFVNSCLQFVEVFFFFEDIPTAHI